jgi:hypothetical protein
MFHHYPAAAGWPDDPLRAAQLWMLDPDRVPPVSMPETLWNQGGLSGMIAWAGVTHQGR